MTKKSFTPETKSIINDISNSVIKIFQLDKFSKVINNFITTKYNKGTEEIEKKFDFNVSFGNQNRDTAMLKQYLFENIQGMTNEIQQKLRQELQRGLMGNETPKQLRARISKIFRGNNPTRFNYENRIKMIARTEGNRAANMATMSGAKEVGVKLYKYTLLNPKDPCPSCKALSEETKAKPIPLNKPFVHRGNKNSPDVKAQHPPFHVNCLCSLVVTQTKGDKNI